MYIYLRVVKPPNPTKQMLLGEAGLEQLWQAFDTTLLPLPKEGSDIYIYIYIYMYIHVHTYIYIYIYT